MAKKEKKEEPLSRNQLVTILLTLRDLKHRDNCSLMTNALCKDCSCGIWESAKIISDQIPD